MTLPAVDLKRGQQKSIDSWYAAPAAINRYLPSPPDLQLISCTSLRLSIDGQTEGRRTVTHALIARSGQRQKQ